LTKNKQEFFVYIVEIVYIIFMICLTFEKSFMSEIFVCNGNNIWKWTGHCQYKQKKNEEK